MCVPREDRLHRWGRAGMPLQTHALCDNLFPSFPNSASSARCGAQLRRWWPASCRSAQPSPLLWKLLICSAIYDRLLGLHILEIMVAVGVQDLDPLLPTGMLCFNPCVRDWEKHRSLRKRARSRSVLLVDSKRRSHISPTLSNMKLNISLLRPFTRRMAECGRIRKPVHLIKEACRCFYDSEAASDDEKKDTTDAKLRKERNINKSAEIIKSMLTAIKRKWSLWEIPRVPWMGHNRIH